MVGCAQETPLLKEGYAALSARQYPEALSLADQQLQRTPGGASGAEAWYLRGRTLEAWQSATAGESARNLAGAREAYERGLGCGPTGQLRAYLRASLGNVAFFQDDYAKAAEMSLLAYDELGSAESRAWTLYRAAVSQQRLGRFELADETFGRVAAQFPGTLQARRAMENRGFRAFYLRLGAFNSVVTGEKAADDLRRKGFRGISLWRDTRGVYLLRLGPYATYGQAKAGRAAVLSRFPDALVMP